MCQKKGVLLYDSVFFVTVNGGGGGMTQIISFLQKRDEKFEQQVERLFQRANSQSQRLTTLLAHHTPKPQDYSYFLAFIAYLEEQQLEPKTVFEDVLRLPKHQFEAHYSMKWSQVVKLCVTFLMLTERAEVVE